MIQGDFFYFPDIQYSIILIHTHLPITIIRLSKTLMRFFRINTWQPESLEKIARQPKKESH